MKKKEIQENQKVKFKLSLVLVSIFLICLLSYFLGLFFTDGLYVGGDESAYNSAYRSKIDSLPIQYVAQRKNSRVVCYQRTKIVDGFYMEELLLTNSKESLGGEISISLLKKGTVLVKKRKSNIFYFLKDGKSYAFKIDTNRNERGELEKKVWPWERVENILDKH
ncbi:hypothetical protein [Wenyingzhuangia sp. IMCC45574]